MRTLIAATFAVLLLPASLVQSGAIDVDPAALVAEYVNPECGAERREKIKAELLFVARDDLLQPLKRHIRRKDERAASLQLACEYKVPGLSREADHYLDDHEAIALDYLFQVQDEKVAGELVRRWVKLSPDSESFKLIDERMRTRWLRPEALEGLLEALDSKDRATQALEVLRHQLNWPEAEAAAIRKEWKPRMQKLSHEGRYFELKGNDLFSLPWNLDAATPVRQNFRVADGKTINLDPFPKPLQDGAFRVKLWVVAGAAKSIKIWFESAENSNTLEFAGGQWTANKCNSIFVNRNAWVELEIRCASPNAREPDRVFTRFVNGRPLTSTGFVSVLSPPLISLSISVEGEENNTLIGGAEWSWG